MHPTITIRPEQDPGTGLLVFRATTDTGLTTPPSDSPARALSLVEAQLKSLQKSHAAMARLAEREAKRIEADNRARGIVSPEEQAERDKQVDEYLALRVASNMPTISRDDAYRTLFPPKRKPGRPIGS